jgi:hypothetical protein
MSNLYLFLATSFAVSTNSVSGPAMVPITKVFGAGLLLQATKPNNNTQYAKIRI